MKPVTKKQTNSPQPDPNTGLIKRSMSLEAEYVALINEHTKDPAKQRRIYAIRDQLEKIATTFLKDSE